MRRNAWQLIYLQFIQNIAHNFRYGHEKCYTTYKTIYKTIYETRKFSMKSIDLKTMLYRLVILAKPPLVKRLWVRPRLRRRVLRRRLKFRHTKPRPKSRDSETKSRDSEMSPDIRDSDARLRTDHTQLQERTRREPETSTTRGLKLKSAFVMLNYRCFKKIGDSFLLTYREFQIHIQ